MGHNFRLVHFQPRKWIKYPATLYILPYKTRDMYRLIQVSYCHTLDARQVGANKVYTLSSIAS